MHTTVIPNNDLMVPEKPYVAQHDTLVSVVEGVASDFTKKTAKLKAALEAVEQQYFESVTRASGALNDHVEVCSRLGQGVEQIEAVITDIKKRMEG